MIRERKEKIVNEIIQITEKMSSIVNNGDGWLPAESMNLLKRSRLDWHLSLTKNLEYWIQNDFQDNEYAKLILAWTNLGAIVEGSLKLVLSIFEYDYHKDIDATRKRNGKLIESNNLSLEKLRIFCDGKIWELDKNRNNWILKIQQFRNSIHAYKDRTIGTFEEFFQDLEYYLNLLKSIEDRIPYPDEIDKNDFL